MHIRFEFLQRLKIIEFFCSFCDLNKDRTRKVSIGEMLDAFPRSVLCSNWLANTGQTAALRNMNQIEKNELGGSKLKMIQT